MLKQVCALALFAALSAVPSSPLAAQTQEGELTIAPMKLPYSAFASAEARKKFYELLENPVNGTPLNGDVMASRTHYDRLSAAIVDRMRQLYPVSISRKMMGGVPVDIVQPKDGVSKANRNRILINLHGGAFMWGSGSGGLVESIPIASVGGFTVISVDYRLAPEFRFPAASEDVEAVYRAALLKYKPRSIGIYGCSAGAILTSESIARLQRKKLPLPGAIGTFCGSLLDMSGDSAILSPALNGQASHPSPKMGDLPYFASASLTDPEVIAGIDPETVRRFPPTLLITGSRDFAMSSVLASQDLLTRNGVDAELHVWDGMWHSFFSDPDIPESRAAYAVIARFFSKRLAQ